LDNAPILLQTGIDLLVDLVEGLADGLPQAIPMIVDCVMKITEVLLDNSDKLIDAGIDLLIALIDGFIEAEPQFIEKMPELLEKLVGALLRGSKKLLNAMIDIAGKMLKNFFKNIPQYAKEAGKIIDVIAKALIGAVAVLIQVGVHLVEGIWSGIVSATSWLKNKITGWVGDVVGFLKKLFKIASPSKVMRDEIGKNLALGVWAGWDMIDPIDRINDDVNNLTRGISVNASYSTGNSSQSLIDYSEMADAMMYAMKQSGFVVELNNREVGRLVRKVVQV
jgi:phage-related protein